MDPLIDRFDGEYAFLSNFFYSAFWWRGKLYLYAENAYQAFKGGGGGDEPIESIRLAVTPGQAKRMGRSVILRPDWEIVKRPIMFTCVWQKFTQNEELRHALLATGDRVLIEGNTWRDYYWGMCNGEGQNWLGKTHMRVRQDLREGRQYTEDELCGLWHAQ